VTAPASIQRRLLALITGVLGALWFGTAALTWLDARHELDELLDAHLAQAAALLVAQQAHELGEEQGVDAPTLHRYAPKVAFQVFHEGRLALRSANAPLSPLAPPQGEPEPPARGFQTVRIGGQSWRVFVTTAREPEVQVYVGEQLASRSDILWAVLRGTLGPALLALPLLWLGAWWSVARGLAPLRVLAQELQTRSPEALHPVPMHDAPSEIRPMVEGLNRLFERVRGLLELERRFTADAAHELRTPIAAIRAQAQVALNESDDTARQRALRATLLGCDRATRLIEQLLTLSRLDADEAGAHEVFDLGELVRSVAAEIAPQALAKSQGLEVDGSEPFTVRSDPILLAVLVRNLLDNAIRYSPAGASVRVALRPAPGALAITIDVSGPGLAPEPLARLGERFFRAAGADAGGSGLGWSIVRRIAAVLGCKVQVGRSAELGGLQATVTIPAPDRQLASA
jgi:two-component system sensor histidine kinase QseC